MKMIPIEVRAYSGYRAEEKPRAFEYQGQRYTVNEITDQSVELQADGRLLRRFRVLTDNGEFDLVFDEQWQGWFLVS